MPAWLHAAKEPVRSCSRCLLPCSPRDGHGPKTVRRAVQNSTGDPTVQCILPLIAGPFSRFHEVAKSSEWFQADEPMIWGQLEGGPNRPSQWGKWPLGTMVRSGRVHPLLAVSPQNQIDRPIAITFFSVIYHMRVCTASPISIFLHARQPQRVLHKHYYNLYNSLFFIIYVLRASPVIHYLLYKIYYTFTFAQLDHTMSGVR